MSNNSISTPYIKMEDIYSIFEPKLRSGEIDEKACFFYISFAGKLVASNRNRTEFVRVAHNQLVTSNKTIEETFNLSVRGRKRILSQLKDFLEIIPQEGGENIYCFKRGVHYGYIDQPKSVSIEKDPERSKQENVQTPQTPTSPKPYRVPSPVYIYKQNITTNTEKVVAYNFSKRSPFKFISKKSWRMLQQRFDDERIQKYITQLENRYKLSMDRDLRKKTTESPAGLLYSALCDEYQYDEKKRIDQTVLHEVEEKKRSLEKIFAAQTQGGYEND